MLLCKEHIYKQHQLFGSYRNVTANISHGISSRRINLILNTENSEHFQTCRSERGTLHWQLSDPDYIYFGRLMFLKQNILSAIKVMKGRVSKNDSEEPEGEQNGLGFYYRNVQKKKNFFSRYVIVRITKIERARTHLLLIRGLSGVLSRASWGLGSRNTRWEPLPPPKLGVA